MIRKLLSFKLSSYVTYLIPVIFAIDRSYLWSAAIIIVAVIIGVLYHWYGERKFARTDTAAACALIAWNAALCWTGGFHGVYFTFAIVLVVLAFAHYFRALYGGSYSLHHGMWHMYGALITMCCLLVAR